MSQKKPMPGNIISSWWSGCINADNGAARKARAELRRASTAGEVLAVESTHILNASLAKANPEWDFSKRSSAVRLALVSAAIAGIDINTRDRLPSRFGQKNGENRLLSHTRFQRIVQAGDDWILATRLRRALPIVARTASVSSLGTDLFYWGDKTQSRWCFDYFSTSSPASLEFDNSETQEA